MVCGLEASVEGLFTSFLWVTYGQALVFGLWRTHGRWPVQNGWKVAFE